MGWGGEWGNGAGLWEGGVDWVLGGVVCFLDGLMGNHGLGKWKSGLNALGGENGNMVNSVL